MYNLSRIFRPITANPQNKTNYREVLPCSSLQPFIRCFWGTPQKKQDQHLNNLNSYHEIIIPDGCMDVIFEINDITNKISSVFCGINNVPFTTLTRIEPDISRYAIRFNFWAVNIFIETSMKNTLNGFLIVEEYFVNLSKEIVMIIIENKSFNDRVRETEKLLLKRLLSKQRVNDNFANAVYYLLKTKGVITVTELSNRVCISDRQLERLFIEYTGASPKKVADIVRFQNVWQEIYLSKACNQQDIAYNYKFYDQSHLINDFKKYTGMTPVEVLQQIK